MIEEISRRIKEDFRDDPILFWHNLKNWKKKKRKKHQDVVNEEGQRRSRDN